MQEYKEGFEKEDQKTIQKYWNYYESCETRKDAQLTRDFIVALPKELTVEQQIKLAQEFIQDQLAKRGMVVDYSLHHDVGNPHLHIASSMRSIEATGFGEKVRAWNDRTFVKKIRESWCEYANFHLKLAGHDVRIDHRSYQEQGIDLIPTFHIGRAAYDLERRGMASEVVAKVEAIRQENLERIKKNPTLVYDKLMMERESFTAEHVVDEVSRYTRATVPDFEKTSRAKVLSPEKINKILGDIEHHESVFTNQDIAKALSEHIKKEDASVFMNALVELKASRDLIYLGAGDDGQDRYTTRKMFKLENGIQNQVDLLKEAKHFGIKPQSIDTYIKEYESLKGKSLLAEQLDAVKYVLSNRQIACIVGRAGTGKSFSLGAANAVWERAGFDVYGVALSGVAADGLNKDAGMNASTIESFKYQIKQGNLQLSSRSVVVMDEAGMTDSLSMAFVIDACQKAGAKLVLVGDHAQLQPVGPGAAFRAIVERMVFKELVTVFRQREEWQKEATIQFAKGEVAAALDAYAQRGCVHYLNKKDAAMEALAASWKDAYTAGTALKEMIVLAYTREDVKTLNETIRDIRVSAGDLKESQTLQSARGKIDLAVGDRLLFLKNNKKYGVKNGRFAVVDGFEEQGGRVLLHATLDGEDAKKVVIDTSDYQDFDYGYAATVHKTQGATVDRSFLYISRGWDRCLAYVGMTRHRERCDVFTDLSKEGLVQEVQKYALKDSLFDFAYHFALRRGFDEDSLGSRLKAHISEGLQTLKTKLVGQYNDLNATHWAAVNEQIENNPEFKSTFERRERARVVAAYVNASREAGKVYAELNLKMAELGLQKLDYQDPRMVILKETEAYKNFVAYLKHRDKLAYDIYQDLPGFELAIEKSNLNLDKIKAGAKKHECRERVKTYVEETAKARVLVRDKLAMQIAVDIKSHYPLLLEAGVKPSHFYNQARSHERRVFTKGLNSVERGRLKEVERYLALEQETIRLYVKHNPQNAPKDYRFTKTPHYERISKERDALAFKILKHLEDYHPQLDFCEIGLARPQFGSLTKPTESAMQKATQRWVKLEKEARSHQVRIALNAYVQAAQGDEALAKQLAFELIKDKKAAFREFAETFGPQNRLWYQIHQDAKAFSSLNFYKGLTSVEDRDLFKAVESFMEVRTEARHAWSEALMGLAAPVNFKAVSGLFADAAKVLSQKKSELARELLLGYRSDHPVYAYFGLSYTDIKNEAGFKKVEDEAMQLIATYQGFCHNKGQGDYLSRAELARRILENKDILKGAITGLKVDWTTLFEDSKHAYRHYLLNTLLPDYKEEVRKLLKYDAVNREVGKCFGEITEYKKQNQASPISLQAKLEKLTAQRDGLASEIALQGNDALISFVLNKDKVAKIGIQAKKHEARLLQVEAYALNRKHYFNALQHCVAKGQYSVDFLCIQDELSELMKPIEKHMKAYGPALRAHSLSQEQIVKDREFFGTYKELAYRTAGFKHASEEAPISVDHQAKMKRAEKIWKGTLPIEGTLAERYLREHRGIEGPLPPSCRFHPGVWHFETGETHPALIVGARNSDRSLGVPTLQAIFLDNATANKDSVLNAAEVSKLTYGFYAEGSAIVINKGKHPHRIVITEGPETGLSIKEADPDLTIFAVLGCGNFKKIPIGPHVKEILFCADNDYKKNPAQQTEIPKSEEKMREAAEYFAEKGIDVYFVMPEKAREDFNDVLKNEGAQRVREYLARPQKIVEGVRVERLEAKVADYLGQPVPAKEKVRMEGAEIILTRELIQLLEDYFTVQDEYTLVADRYFKNIRSPDRASIKLEKEKAAEPVKACLEKLLENSDYLEMAKNIKYKLVVNEDAGARLLEATKALTSGRIDAELAYCLVSKIESGARTLNVGKAQSEGKSRSV